jgi:hypothetical protein
LLYLSFNKERKEVNKMKTARVLLATLLLAGSFVAAGTVKASDGVITKDEFTPGSYCHMKFPALQENSLGTNHPTLKSATSGDVIDFYGPCNENPTGQDQVDAQKLDRQHSHYND